MPRILPALLCLATTTSILLGEVEPHNVLLAATLEPIDDGATFVGGVISVRKNRNSAESLLSVCKRRKETEFVSFQRHEVTEKDVEALRLLPRMQSWRMWE